MKYIIFSLFFLLGCEECYINSRFQNITDYEININTYTPKGIAVDTSGFNVNLEYIDLTIDVLEACLEIPIERACFEIKIVPDWFIHPCSESGELQVFDCGVTNASCGGSEECPCLCAGVVQDRNVAIITPNLMALAHEVTHIVTDLNDPFPEDVLPCANIWVK